MKSGSVYWVTGLSGSGKTTIGRLLYNHLNSRKPNVVYFDGDELRLILVENPEYTLSAREELAKKYSMLCHLLASQGIDVICATISMFNNIRKWNRDNIENYHEIYLKVPLEVLVERDTKNIYNKNNDNKIENIVGIDLKFDEPESPDITINNDGAYSKDEVLKQIIREFKL